MIRVFINFNSLCNTQEVRFDKQPNDKPLGLIVRIKERRNNECS